MLSRGDLRQCSSTYLFWGICSADIHLFDGAQNLLTAFLELCHMGTAQVKNCSHRCIDELNFALQAEFGCNTLKLLSSTKRHAFFLTFHMTISHKSQQWLMACLILQICLSRYFWTEWKRMENLALTMRFCLFAIMFLLLLPPAHCNHNNGSHRRSKVSAGHIKSIVRFNPVLRRAVQYTNKS